MVQLEIRFGCAGTLKKERDRGIFGEVFNRGLGARIRHCQRRYGKFVLTVNMESGAARNQDFETWTHCQQISDRRRGLQKMLEVIEEEEHRRTRWVLEMLFQQFDR